MRKAISFYLKIIGMGAWLGAAALCHAETIEHSVSGNFEEWYIDSPIVNSVLWENFLGEIVFRPFDTVFLSAGGCVQTGGHGLTWKRYVDPQGPNSTDLYHGWFALPGFPISPLSSLLSPSAPGSDVYEGQFTINGAVTDRDTLFLHYKDDGYGDNGYYAHDDGTGDQCKNIGNAWVHVAIFHQ